MRSIIIILIAISVGLGGGYLLFHRSQGIDRPAQETPSVQYTCGMHPEIISDEPGYCPICGMKLIPKRDGGGSSEGAIAIDATTVQNMGLKTQEVAMVELGKSIRLFGKVDYSEPLIRTVNVKITGWIEKLYIDYEGDYVENGAPLLEIYSPELVAAQREYLVAYSNHERLKTAEGTAISGSDQLMEAAAMRLRNWDISHDQIRKLVSNGEPARTMLIRSPYDGVVISKHVDPGDHINPGAIAYKIADISRLWIKAFAYEQDLPFLRLGQNATIAIPSIPAESFSATVSYISPYLDRNRQAEIRLDTANPDLKLKPGMYAEVNIESRLPGKRMAIPLKAVINSGAKKIVYIDNHDGSYSPRLIKTGVYGDGDLVEVISGLDMDDRIVVSGQFLLDSESRLNEALIPAQAHGHDHGSSHNHKEKLETVEKELSGIYTCPMPEHYHVLQYGEGQCPECGMDLVPVEQTDNAEVYYCPMEECGIVRSEPGECPVCGMNLVKLKRDDNHDQ